MILVDSTVLIDYLRTRDKKLYVMMKTNDGAVCGVIGTEVLHGARGPKHRQRILAALNAPKQIATPEDIWDIVGDNLAMPRGAGITVPFADAVIATVAIENEVELLQLRLFQEPP